MATIQKTSDAATSDSKAHSMLAWLNDAHGEMLKLCTALEEIADSLPNEVNRQKCIYAAKSLGPTIKEIHVFEEGQLFPWIGDNIKDQPNLPATLDRLKFEHCEDECFAEELIDTLNKIGYGQSEINAEAIGYMLRGFFEGMRRHIAFEREHLLPLIQRQLA